MAEDINMDSFIRDTLRSYERIRDKSFDPIQQTIVSKQSFSTNLSSPRTESANISPIATGSIIGGGGNHPFKITVKSGKEPTYKVFLRSSIINGTNGGPFNITGLNEDKEITEEKFIVAEATVTSNPFEVTNDGFTINAVGANDTNEVLLEGGKQTKLRLLIGKITVEPLLDGEGTEIGKALKAWQAVTTSFRTAVSFFNGVPVYILQAAPTHQSSI
jgi:hypothetical protein